MRELERDFSTSTPAPRQPAHSPRLLVVGAGRAGGAIACAARRAGLEVRIAGREAAAEAAHAECILLCVPDDAIEVASESLAPVLRAGTMVGHISGASGLERLAAAAQAGARAFSLHPLQTIPDGRSDIAGASCAVAARDPQTLAEALNLARRLGLEPFELPDESRALYHGAATVASNFLVTLEEVAATLMARAGVANPRAALRPLVLRTAANWADAGAAALTGPIARGDEQTVERHRAALAEHAPELADLYDALAERTRALAGEGAGG